MDVVWLVDAGCVIASDGGEEGFEIWAAWCWLVSECGAGRVGFYAVLDCDARALVACYVVGWKKTPALVLRHPDIRACE